MFTKFSWEKQVPCKMADGVQKEVKKNMFSRKCHHIYILSTTLLQVDCFLDVC